MANPQFHPLELNPKTGEPFLRLREHSNIILTPPRWEDVPVCVPYMNDPVVQDGLGSPYPYTLEHSKRFIETIKPAADEILQQLKEAQDDSRPILIGYSPMRAIREVKEDGTDRFIGDLGVFRCPRGELMGPNGVDWANKEKREAENNGIPLGDPSIIWSMGDWLVPSYHGQGIMTDAVGTVLHSWAIPRMGVRHIRVSAFTGNGGSVKVFLKNGFKLIETDENHTEVNGKMRGLHVLEWRYEG